MLEKNSEQQVFRESFEDDLERYLVAKGVESVLANLLSRLVLFAGEDFQVEHAIHVLAYNPQQDKLLDDLRDARMQNGIDPLLAFGSPEPLS